MPNYDYKCSTCGEVFEKFVQFADRDKEQECPVDAEPSFMLPPSPMVLNASYPDGYRRRHHAGWQAVKEKSELKKERAGIFKRSA